MTYGVHAPSSRLPVIAHAPSVTWWWQDMPCVTRAADDRRPTRRRHARRLPHRGRRAHRAGAAAVDRCHPAADRSRCMARCGRARRRCRRSSRTRFTTAGNSRSSCASPACGFPGSTDRRERTGRRWEWNRPPSDRPRTIAPWRPAVASASRPLNRQLIGGGYRGGEPRPAEGALALHVAPLRAVHRGVACSRVIPRGRSSCSCVPGSSWRRWPPSSPSQSGHSRCDRPARRARFTRPTAWRGRERELESCGCRAERTWRSTTYGARGAAW